MYHRMNKHHLLAVTAFMTAAFLSIPAFAGHTSNHSSAIGGQLSGGVTVSQGSSSASVSSSGNGSASVSSGVVTTGEAAAGGSVFHNGVDQQSGYQSSTQAGITTTRTGGGKASGGASGGSAGLSGSIGALGTLSGWNL